MELAAEAAQQVAVGGTVCTDLILLRGVQLMVVALVDGLADRGIFFSGVGGGWAVQACVFLQICLSDRAI